MQELYSLLAKEIEECGELAKERQKGIRKSFKTDGTPVTPADLEISSRVIKFCREHFPGWNIVSEEEKTPFSPDAPFTFVLDPIDGTDSFAEGLPSWCVSLGILDSERRPVGAYIAAPRFGVASERLFVRLDPGGELLINGEPVKIDAEAKFPVKQAAFSFSNATGLDLTRLDDTKIRAFGSSVLHLLTPVIFKGYQSALLLPNYVWDVAAAHAVLLKAGFKILYPDFTPPVYDDRLVIEKQKFPQPLIAGNERAIRYMKEAIFG